MTTKNFKFGQKSNSKATMVQHMTVGKIPNNSGWVVERETTVLFTLYAWIYIHPGHSVQLVHMFLKQRFVECEWIVLNTSCCNMYLLWNWDAIILKGFRLQWLTIFVMFSLFLCDLVSALVTHKTLMPPVGHDFIREHSSSCSATCWGWLLHCFGGIHSILEVPTWPYRYQHHFCNFLE